MKKRDEKTEILKQIITGDGLGNKRDVEQIHLENLQRLSQMKPEEILEEQRKLTEQLDPRIVSFIRKKKLNNQNEILNNDVNSSEGNDELEKESLSIIVGRLTLLEKSVSVQK